MGVCRLLGFDHSPQLTDGLLQVALVQVRNRAVEDRVDVIGVHAIEHLSKDLDSLVELLRLYLLSALAYQLIASPHHRKLLLLENILLPELFLRAHGSGAIAHGLRAESLAILAHILEVPLGSHRDTAFLREHEPFLAVLH